MARAPEEQAWIDGFAEIYRVAQAPIMRKIERRV
jgi:hypothetical protein